MVMPSPVQPRAYATVRDAIDAAVELIGERGEDSVRILDVVERSGVSAGSITHHFGSRDGLIAAALMELFDRAAQQRARSFDLDVTDPARFSAGMAGMIASSAAGERDAWRLARVRGLAYARRRPELRAAVIDSVATLERDIATRVVAGASRAATTDVSPDVSPLALVVFSEAYSAGRIVDTTFGDPLPMDEWVGLFTRLVRAFTSDDVLGPVRDVPGRSASANTVAPLVRPPIPELDLDGDERRVLEVAIEVERLHGPQAVRVRDLVTRTGLSRSWFARHFGELELILDAVHLSNLIGFSRQECALIEAAFDEADGSDDLARRLDEVVAAMSRPEALSGAWSRVQLVSTASGRPELAEQAAPIVAAALARTSAAIVAAQHRGLVHHDVPARALARFLWAAPLAFVFGEVVGVEWRELHLLGQHASRTWIVPDVAPGLGVPRHA